MTILAIVFEDPFLLGEFDVRQKLSYEFLRILSFQFNPILVLKGENILLIIFFLRFTPNLHRLLFIIFEKLPDVFTIYLDR